VSGADGTVVAGGVELLNRLVTQGVAPEPWDRCLSTLADLGVTGVVELSPAGTLPGLIHRTLPAVDVVALRSPADLDAARSLMAVHLNPEHANVPPPAWRLVVAPTAGTFHPADP
jgi:[acyl-carrier-protein] S-malonyltransferase